MTTTAARNAALALAQAEDAHNRAKARHAAAAEAADAALKAAMLAAEAAKLAARDVERTRKALDDAAGVDYRARIAARHAAVEAHARAAGAAAAGGR